MVKYEIGTLGEVDVPYTEWDTIDILSIYESNSIAGALANFICVLQKEQHKENRKSLLNHFKNNLEKNYVTGSLEWPPVFEDGLGVLYSGYEVIYVPLNQVPLYINSTMRSVALLAMWRLEHGK